MANRARLEDLASGRSAPHDLEPEEFEAVEFRRIQFSLYMALVAEAIPRRLGKEAESGALALDKRVSRKVANVYRVVWMRNAQLTGGPPAPSLGSREGRLGLARSAENGSRRAGATVSWGRWLPEQIAIAEGKREEVAALAVSRGLVKWGWRRARVLTEEITNLERIGIETSLTVRGRNGSR